MNRLLKDSQGYIYDSASHPAIDPLVLAVGGTSPTLDNVNHISSEMAWGITDPNQWIPGYTAGSGGGISKVFSDITNNSGVNSTMRGIPDVSIVASGLMMYQSSTYGWMESNGTSFSAPIWAGILSLSAQKAGHKFGWINQAINAIAQDPNMKADFNDITTGYNGGYTATSGWDAVTGWGSPANGWNLIQDLAKQSNKTSVSANVAAMLVGGTNYPGQPILNGVQTIDLIGNGLGSTPGTVTLSGNGLNNVPVPILSLNNNKLWNDHDITLDMDHNTGNGLFETTNISQGTYTLTIHTQAGQSLTKSITFDDYIVFQNNSTGAVGSPETITMTAIQPDGNHQDTTINSTLNFGIFALGSNNSCTLTQGSALLQPFLSFPGFDQYHVSFSGGIATVQVNTQLAGDYVYSVSNQKKEMGGVLQTFSSASSNHFGVMTDTNNNVYVPVNGGSISLTAFDQFNNKVDSATDQLKASYSNGSGTVMINSQTVTQNTYSNAFNMLYGGYAINLQDTTAETVTLNVYDLTNATVQHIPVNFTAAQSIDIAPVSSVQAGSWQNVTVSAKDILGQTVAFSGLTYFMADQDVTVEQQVYGSGTPGTWQSLNPDPYYNDFALDLSHGAANIRVKSLEAGTVQYQAQMNMGNQYISSTSVTSQVNPSAPTRLDLEPVLPHMATSSASNLQYAPVQVVTMDSYFNFVNTQDQYSITQISGPSVTLATDNNGTMQTVTPNAGVWTISSDPTGFTNFYVASTQPGMAVFQVADLTNSSVATNQVSVDFVNSMASSLQANSLNALQANQVQALTVNVVDQNGQTVITNNDQIAIHVSSYSGTMTVTDATYNPISLNSQGQYVSTAANGSATFHIQDSTSENVNYTISDLTQSKVTGINVTNVTPNNGGSYTGGGVVIVPPTDNTDTPTTQTNKEVHQDVDSSQHGVKVTTKDNSVTLVFPQGTFDKKVQVKVTRVDDDKTQIPAGNSLIASVWKFDAGGQTLKKPVKVTFKLKNPTQGIPTGQIGVYTKVNGVWKFFGLADSSSSNGEVTITLPHFSEWTVMKLANFKDLAQTNWAFSFVEELLGRKAVAGYPDGTFKPDKAVTRAEFMKMIITALDINPASLDKEPFADVHSTDWYTSYLDTAFQKGMMKGDEKKLAHPNQWITRQEAAVILNNILGQTQYTAGPIYNFKDSKQIATWAFQAIQRDRDLGLIQGYPDGNFKPTKSLTRSEAAAIIIKLIKKTK